MENLFVLDQSLPALDLDAPISLGDIDLGFATDLYSRMFLIREFEQRVNRLFLKGRIPGTIHLSHGQEACAVGATACLRPTDWTTLTHRGHGQALAKGVTARALMAELFARETGCCRGRGGSLHVGDMAVCALPAIAIVGASIPIAAGLAFAAKQAGEDRIALCFTGDGAITEGDSHEGFNIAALWRLPVVYVCENNQYSVSTPLRRQTRLEHIVDRVRAYDLPGVIVDGNDVTAVYAAVSAAVDRARGGGGPQFVECLTYRQGGHKRDDPATYRPKEEVALWLSRDPVVRMRCALDAAGLTGEAETVEAAARAAIDDAVEFADSSPLAVADEL
jgi:TPP-dependent pyruvate/acetoin dehydrogenase alpha subunit